MVCTLPAGREGSELLVCGNERLYELGNHHLLGSEGEKRICL